MFCGDENMHFNDTINEILIQLMGNRKDELSRSFMNLLNYYDLTEVDGFNIKEETSNFGFHFWDDKCHKLFYKVWVIDEFKKNFIKQYNAKFSKFPDNFEKLNNYCVDEELLNYKNNLIEVKRILEPYMGENLYSKQYLQDLVDYNLLSGFAEITLYFLTKSIKEYQNITNVRDYVLDFLKKLDNTNEIDETIPQNISEAVDFIIINSNKDYIKKLKSYHFNLENLYNNKERNFIFKYFNLDFNSHLLYDCFKSKYNNFKYDFAILVDDDLANYVILNSLVEEIRRNYEKIMEMVLKDNFIESEDDYFLLDKIDGKVLLILDELIGLNEFNEDFENLLDDFSFDKWAKIKLKFEILNQCSYLYMDSSDKLKEFLVRDRIIGAVEKFLDTPYFNKNNDLMKLKDFLNYKKFEYDNKFDYKKHLLKAQLKYDFFVNLLVDEIENRNLKEYFCYMDFFDFRWGLNNKENINKYLDYFEDSYVPYLFDLEDSIQYLTELSSKEFIQHIKECSKQEFIDSCTFSLDLYIRNEFGLNSGRNKALLYDLYDSEYYRLSTDMNWASDAVLSEFWSHVQDNYDEIIKRTEFKNKISLHH